MGHTIPPKRIIIYGKLDELKRFAKSMREPLRSRFLGLADTVYPHVSSIVNANTLNDEEMMVYAMLAEKAKGTSFEDEEKVLKCLAVLLR